jgi:hypothetical protein
METVTHGLGEASAIAVAGRDGNESVDWLEAHADKFPIFKPGSFGSLV